MAALAWVMMAIAIWHFTVFVPDRFWAGIVGAFGAAIVGAVVFGFVVNGFTVPGTSETDLIQAIEAIPGTLIGLGICYLVGSRQVAASADEDAS